MIDPTAVGFYTKNPEENYIDTYDVQHGERLDKLVEHYKLNQLKGVRVADVGGGLGFLGRRLDPSVDYWVFDGADYPEEKRVSKGTWVGVDVQRSPFGRRYTTYEWANPGCDIAFREHDTPLFDVTFCLETLEHLSDPYHCLIQMKAMTKPDGDIFISVPTETVWHNVVYPGLMWPQQNWEQFLGQMALPILDRWTYTPSPGRGWPAYCHRLRNANWTEARYAFPKAEAKFRGKTPVEMTNL